MQLKMIEVIYVPENGVIFRNKLSTEQSMSVSEALESSGVILKHPETANYAVGVFAQTVTKDTLLKPGDRLEIYRPLRVDPKVRRKQRS